MLNFQPVISTPHPPPKKKDFFYLQLFKTFHMYHVKKNNILKLKRNVTSQYNDVNCDSVVCNIDTATYFIQHRTFFFALAQCEHEDIKRF